MFATAIDKLTCEITQESGGLAFEFEDDITICSESRKQVEENIERWRFYHINERCKGQQSRATESLEENMC